MDDYVREMTNAWIKNHEEPGSHLLSSCFSLGIELQLSFPPRRRGRRVHTVSVET